MSDECDLSTPELLRGLARTTGAPVRLLPVPVWALQAGAALLYHGDFDWPGLRIGNHVMRVHGAGPWRFASADYQAALRMASSPGRQLQGEAVDASWDEALAAAMHNALQAIDEEAVADLLLQDLATQNG